MKREDFPVGARVRVVTPGYEFHGRTGIVNAYDGPLNATMVPVQIDGDDFPHGWLFEPDDVALIAEAEARQEAGG